MYPDAIDSERVSSYSAVAQAGGGFVWDAVLEYRVWFHPERGAEDLENGNDYYFAFATYAEALARSQSSKGSEQPLALILQEEYIDEPEAGNYLHIREQRITEWPVTVLTPPRRTANTIPAFLAPDAPPNRLDILRGLVK